MPKGGFRFNGRGLSTELKTFNPKVDKALTAAFAYQESRSETRMRTQARWTDQTGNARSSLFAKASKVAQTYKLLLSHGVGYGIYLETRFSGRYAIVRPEILLASSDLQRLIRKLIATL